MQILIVNLEFYVKIQFNQKTHILMKIKERKKIHAFLLLLVKDLSFSFSPPPLLPTTDNSISSSYQPFRCTPLTRFLQKQVKLCEGVFS